MKLFVLMGEARDPNNNNPLFWNNEDGWTDLSGADVFTESQIEHFLVPLEAWSWLELPEETSDLVQAYQYEADAKAAALENEDVYF